MIISVNISYAMESARPRHRFNTGGGQPPPPTVPPVQHASAVAVLEHIAQENSTVKERGGVETTVFGVRGGKGDDLKGV